MKIEFLTVDRFSECMIMKSWMPPEKDKEGQMNSAQLKP
jgi:hypothetical protein